MTVLDVAPTILDAMGLPSAESFPGRARLELVRNSLRRRHPLPTIPTWGAPREGQATASAVDPSTIEQAAALGHIESARAAAAAVLPCARFLAPGWSDRPCCRARAHC